MITTIMDNINKSMKIYAIFNTLDRTKPETDMLHVHC